MDINLDHYDKFMDELNRQEEIVNFVNGLINISDNMIIRKICAIIRDASNILKFQKLKTSFILLHMSNPEAIALIEHLDPVYSLKDRNLDCFEGKDEIYRLGWIRGSILEVLIKELVVNRSQFVETNCRIEIDNVLQQLPTNPNPQTMDVVGLDSLSNPQSGEIYEAKVGPKAINANDFLFTKHLRDTFITRKCPDILIGIICLEGLNEINNIITKKLRLPLDFNKYVVTLPKIDSLWKPNELKKILA